MLADAQYSGLCTTCKQAPDCTLAGCARNPVVYCEEFDTGEPCAAENQARAPSRTVRRQRSRSSAKLLGLCRNCENSGSCAFPKPEGGIWHCEEYQ